MKFGLNPLSGSQTHLKKRAIDFEISFDHFIGPGWNLGRKFEPKRPLDDYLNNKVGISSANLRKRLIRDGYKTHQCELCLATEHRDRPIPLELDHRDSNHYNNNLSNLQLICPTCHHFETVDRRIK